MTILFFRNPLKTLHDQGAGGNGNVLKELVEDTSESGENAEGGRGGGGVIHASRFTLGDSSISAMEIWGAEYQESNAALVRAVET